jgi:DNA-binding MarR family transcriptional regulator
MSSTTPERQRAITLIALLRRASRAMIEEITERMEAAGFPDSPSRHYPVFENLDPDGTRLTVLATRAGITHQAMGELIGELVERGVVERVADPSDGRARLIRLTEEGRAIIGAAVREIAAIERTWARRLELAGLHGDLRAAFEHVLAERGESGER